MPHVFRVPWWSCFFPESSLLPGLPRFGLRVLAELFQSAESLGGRGGDWHWRRSRSGDRRHWHRSGSVRLGREWHVDAEFGSADVVDDWLAVGRDGHDAEDAV